MTEQSEKQSGGEEQAFHGASFSGIRCAEEGTYYKTSDALGGGPVSLYLHFPFCVRKCRYCDFLSYPAKEEERAAYLGLLEQEIREKATWLGHLLYGGNLPCVDTIFFGGGTPSLMTQKELDHLMFVLASCFLIDSDAEITLECNPGTVTEEKLDSFRRSGINRLSIGVQSFREEELRMLGRIHTEKEARQCIESAERVGFDSISLDLISALPGQSFSQWMESLREAVSWEPEHLSCYSLILEDGTPLKREYVAQYGTDEEPDEEEHSSLVQKEEKAHLSLPPLPSVEEDRRMYHETREFLGKYGYRRYEISNYARPGYRSRHNSGYWTGHPYLGLGLGASSYLAIPGKGRIRFANPDEMTSYSRMVQEDPSQWIRSNGVEELSLRDQMAEFMFLGLRRMDGVRCDDFAQEFGQPIEAVYGDVIARYQDLGLLAQKEGRIYLTDAGIDVSNTVMAEFL